MSHGDKVTRLPDGFAVYARSDSCEHAAVGDEADGSARWSRQMEQRNQREKLEFDRAEMNASKAFARDRRFNDRDGLMVLANETGGRAIFNQNTFDLRWYDATLPAGRLGPAAVDVQPVARHGPDGAARRTPAAAKTGGRQTPMARVLVQQLLQSSTTGRVHGYGDRAPPQRRAES